VRANVTTAKAAVQARAAITDAISAAREWAEHRTARGAAKPVPRPVAALVASGELDAKDGEMAVMIPAG